MVKIVSNSQLSGRRSNHVVTFQVRGLMFNDISVLAIIIPKHKSANQNFVLVIFLSSLRPACLFFAELYVRVAFCMLIFTAFFV